MRKVICFIVATGLVIGGAYIFIGLWLSPGSVKIMYFLGAGSMAFGGAAWLWADYIGPLFGAKTEGVEP